MLRRERKSKNWIKIFVSIILLSLLVLGGSIFVIRREYNRNLRPVSASQKNVIFIVHKGASVKEVGVALEKANLIRASWAFEWYFRNNKLSDFLKAGTYNLRPNLSVQEIVEIITQGRIATDLVTIKPGLRLDQIRSVLINKYGFSTKDVDEALNPANYSNHPALVDKPKDASLEGYLYPESFQKTAETNPKVIIRSSLDQMQKYLTPELRAGIVRQRLTVHQGIILASIIEQEVSDASDKRTVAQVFLKRLRDGLKLESDATATYGAVLSGDIDKLSRAQVLNYESKYNTYLHSGLPPTPISNITLSSLEAVANPTNTDYLYFVSGDDGKTYFSHTLQEHEEKTKQYCTVCR